MEKRIRTLGGLFCLLLVFGVGWLVYHASRPDPKGQPNMQKAAATPSSTTAKISSAPAPKFTSFASWTDQFLSAPADEKAQLEQEGIELARQRRATMYWLIQNDPKAAVESA